MISFKLSSNKYTCVIWCLQKKKFMKTQSHLVFVQRNHVLPTVLSKCFLSFVPCTFKCYVIVFHSYIINMKLCCFPPVHEHTTTFMTQLFLVMMTKVFCYFIVHRLLINYFLLHILQLLVWKINFKLKTAYAASGQSDYSLKGQ